MNSIMVEKLFNFLTVEKLEHYNVCPYVYYFICLKLCVSFKFYTVI